MTDTQGATQPRFHSLFAALPPLQQVVLEACAVFSLPTSPAIILTLLQKANSLPASLLKTTEKEISVALAALKDAQLLSTAGHQCRADLVELVMRQALTRGHLKSLAQASLHARTPASGQDIGSDEMEYQHCLRAIRLAVYRHDVAQFHRGLLRYFQIKHGPRHPDPLVLICDNPFDPDWFQNLPFQIQLYALNAIFKNGLRHLLPTQPHLAYLRRRQTLSRIPEDYRPSFYYLLISQLLLQGDFQEARQAIARAGDTVISFGLSGWLAFFEGKTDKAIRLFAEDLDQLRKINKNKDAYFTGIEGLFYLLALLSADNFKFLPTIDKTIEAVAAVQPHNIFLPAYQVLKWAVAILENRGQEFRHHLEQTPARNLDSITTLFLGAGHSWLSGKIPLPLIKSLRENHDRAARNGYDWLAFEYGRLLRLDHTDAIETGKDIPPGRAQELRSVVDVLQYKEPWQRALRALDNASLVPLQARDWSRTRLAWWLRHDKRQQHIDIFPKIQQINAKGQWTKGRSIALRKLYGPEKPAFLSAQDRKICQSLRQERDKLGIRYRFTLARALPAMIGHPYLFLADAPGVPATLDDGEPELWVEERKGFLHIRFFPEIDSGEIVVVPETPTHFKIIAVSDEHRRVAGIIGKKGLRIPCSARDELFHTLGNISSFMTVHSSTAGEATGIRNVPADSRIHIHLLPYGSGLRLSMYVRPLAATGPYLKPGKGPLALVGGKDGRRTQTSRNLSLEEENARGVEAACPSLTLGGSNDREWLLPDPEECLQILDEFRNLPQDVLVEWPEGERFTVSPPAPLDRLHMSVRKKNNWFEVSGRLKLDDALVLDMRKLLELVPSTASRFIPLGHGHYLALSNELRKRLDEIQTYAECRKTAVRIHPLAALAMEGLVHGQERFTSDSHWRDHVARLKNIDSLDPAIPSTLQAQLRDYQVDGFKWLARLAQLGVGACLADDMGLGKTVQALAIVLARAAQGPTLIVAPTSVCLNWREEAKRFAPVLNIKLFNSRPRRETVREIKPFDVLICSYGLLQQDAELLASREWQTIVLDEAQAIKNFSTKRSRAAMKLRSRFKLITTGTPIENHLSELWNLFRFINPGLLGSLRQFNKRFSLPIEKEGNQEVKRALKKLIRPFILRRIKSQVLEELPSRTEITLQVDMGKQETALYEALRQKALEKLRFNGGLQTGDRRLQILAEIMKLRRVCCNPRLIVPDTPIASSKLELFGKILEELRENRHKALVFSQFVDHLRIIRRFLEQKNISYQYLDGKTPAKTRQKRVEAFQAGHGDVFLISLKAGGTGLNLTAANYVIHMDPWWNPAVEDQASDRAHRIGQEQPVTIYRLITQGTIEEKIVRLHKRKKKLADSLLEGAHVGRAVSPEELLELLE